MQLWLSDHSQAAAQFAMDYLTSHPATGNDINSATKAVPTSGLGTVYAGSEVANYFGAKASDSPLPRHPRHRTNRRRLHGR